jgi:predicted DNA-binding transcriptional regulator AlpA
MADVMKNPINTNTKLINQKQVAEIIGLSEAWLERKRWEGGGIPYRKLGRAVRYDERDVLDWIEAHGKQYSTSACGN